MNKVLLLKKIHVMYRNENGKYILLIFLIFGMPVCLIENVKVTDQTDIWNERLALISHLFQPNIAISGTVLIHIVFQKLASYGGNCIITFANRGTNFN